MRRLLLLTAIAVGVVAGTQLVLPGLAAERLAARLADRGSTVRDVSVTAVPALKLVAGMTDEVRLQVDRLELDAGVGGRLGRVAGADRVSVTIDHLQSRRLDARAVRFDKDGDAFTASLRLGADGLKVAGGRVGVTAAATAAGDLELRAPALGLAFRVVPREGALALEPVGAAGGLLAAAAGRGFPLPDTLEVDRLVARPVGDGVELTLSGAVADA